MTCIIQSSFTALKILCALPRSPLPPAHAQLFTVSTVLPFTDHHIVAIRQYVAVSDWLLSLSVSNHKHFYTISLFRGIGQREVASGARHEIKHMSSCVKPTGNVSQQGQSQLETACSIYLIKNKETKKLYKPSVDHQWVTLFYKNPIA